MQQQKFVYNIYLHLVIFHNVPLTKTLLTTVTSKYKKKWISNNNVFVYKSERQNNEIYVGVQ